MSAHQRCGTVSGIARIRADGAEGKGGRGYTQENVSMRASMCRASSTTHHPAHSCQATCFRLPYTLSRALCRTWWRVGSGSKSMQSAVSDSAGKGGGPPPAAPSLENPTVREHCMPAGTIAMRGPSNALC